MIDLSDMSHYCFTTQIGHLKGWFIDSGATCHMTNSKDNFESFDPNVTESVHVADGDEIKTQGMGNLFLQCGKNKVLIKDV